jgi:hypothetical protein
VDSQEFDTNEIGFDSRFCAVVPIAFLDRLLKCYYGYGSRDGEQSVDKSVKIPEIAQPSYDVDQMRDMFVRTELPAGYIPKGVAKRKAEIQDGKRHDKTAEE